jgi:hypothetical protein
MEFRFVGSWPRARIPAHVRATVGHKLMRQGRRRSFPRRPESAVHARGVNSQSDLALRFTNAAGAPAPLFLVRPHLRTLGPGSYEHGDSTRCAHATNFARTAHYVAQSFSPSDGVFGRDNSFPIYSLLWQQQLSEFFPADTVRSGFPQAQEPALGRFLMQER